MRHELLSSYLACTPAGCDAVISALGHNLTLRGMYGAPRKLCTDTVSQLCRVAEMLQPARPIRLIAISTEGVDRPDGADPPRGRAERLVTLALTPTLTLTLTLTLTRRARAACPLSRRASCRRPPPTRPPWRPRPCSAWARSRSTSSLSPTPGCHCACSGSTLETGQRKYSV